MKEVKFTILAVASLLFISFSSCKKHCSVPSNCQLEPEVGPCDAAFPRYYYDQQAKECKQFIWGGCEGVVPFDTLEECERCLCR